MDPGSSTSQPPRKPKKRKRTVVEEPQQEPLVYPWKLVGKKRYATPDQQLHHDIVAYTNYVRPTSQEIAARSRVFSTIERVVKSRFRNCTVGLFGSSATDLTIPVPDLDIVVSMDPMPPDSDVKKCLFQLRAKLRNEGLTDDAQVRHHATVPIIAFTTLPEYGSLSVDIGINNTDGLTCVKLVNQYLSTMPALRPLTLVVKGFLKQRQLHSASSGALGSYAATCMCISFLQLNPSSRPEEQIQKPYESESLGRLFTNFLTYYGQDFPYSTSYISVTEGKLLPKEKAEWIKTKVPDRLAIQCLLRSENDIAKATARIDEVKAAFKEAADKLLQASIRDYRLSLVLGIPQSVVEHREEIKQLVERWNRRSQYRQFTDRRDQHSGFTQRQNGYQPPRHHPPAPFGLRNISSSNSSYREGASGSNRDDSGRRHSNRSHD